MIIGVKIQDYNIEFKDINQADLEKCDTIYAGNSYYEFSSFVQIKIFGNSISKIICIAGDGGATSLHQNSFIVENDRLMVCCTDTVFCLEIPSLNLVWSVKADPFTCFGLYKQNDMYVVHGELTISRIDENGKLLWQNGGCDIFTTPEGNSDDFYVADSYIFATDWDYNIYKFDFDGNIIK